MKYWIVKTEPTTFSIDDLKREGVTCWNNVRNYQARNHLCQMAVGDLVFVYHSSCDVPGVVGLAVVKKAAYPDPTQFDRKSEYFDPKATKENPRWFAPDLKFKKKFKSTVALNQIREVRGLAEMVLLKQGNRLSVMPLSDKEYELLIELEERVK